MSTELATREPDVPAAPGGVDVPATFVERIELCKFLAEADLLPPPLRKKPANVLLIMHKAVALNIPLTVALEHLHVIEGKVGHSAELLRGLVERHGHTIDWIETSSQRAVMDLWLKGKPKPKRVEFTIAEAQRMGLVNKKNWKESPEAMLVARCTTRAVSWHVPSVGLALGNLSAIDAPVDEDPHTGEPIQAQAETGQSFEAAARELWERALQCDATAQLTAIDREAKDRDLLGYAVDGETTLQQALLRRISELGKDDKDDKAGKGSGGDGAKRQAKETSGS